MRPTAFAIAMGALVGAQSSCIVGGAFACLEDAQCSGDGVCEPTGWCSFPDASCSSGTRYSPWAGDGLANDCTDEPLASTSTTTETDGTGDAGPSGPPVERDSEGPECGNGIREVGEACDDMNAVDGDGCNAGCVVSGTLAWAVQVENQGDDFGHDVAFTSTGLVYVAGQSAGDNGNGSLLRIDADDGSTIWSQFIINSSPDAALGVTVAENLSDGDDIIAHALYVVGYVTPSDDPDEPPPPPGENQLARRYDDLGGAPAQDWSSTYNSSQNGDDRLNDVELSFPLGQVVVFGHVRNGLADVDRDAAVRAFPTGSSNDAWFFNAGVDANADDSAAAGVIDDEGRVFAVGERTKTNGDVDAWIAHFAVSGDPPVVARDWTAFVAVADRDDSWADIAIDPAGLLVAVGRRGPGAWIAAFEPATDEQIGADAPVWEMQPPDMPADARLSGLAFDGAGAIVLVGSVETVDRGADAWVQKLDPGLTTTIWSAQGDGSAGRDDFARAVAIGPDDRVVVVGDRVDTDPTDLADGVDRDVWIELHAP